MRWLSQLISPPISLVDGVRQRGVERRLGGIGDEAEDRHGLSREAEKRGPDSGSDCQRQVGAGAASGRARPAASSSTPMRCRSTRACGCSPRGRARPTRRCRRTGSTARSSPSAASRPATGPAPPASSSPTTDGRAADLRRWNGTLLRRAHRGLCRRAGGAARGRRLGRGGGRGPRPRRARQAHRRSRSADRGTPQGARPAARDPRAGGAARHRPVARELPGRDAARPARGLCARDAGAQSRPRGAAPAHRRRASPTMLGARRRRRSRARCSTAASIRRCR